MHPPPISKAYINMRRIIMLFLTGLQAVTAFSPSTLLWTKAAGPRGSPKSPLLESAMASPAMIMGNERLPGWWCRSTTVPSTRKTRRSRRHDRVRSTHTALGLTTTATGGATTRTEEEVGDAETSQGAPTQKMGFVTPKMRVFIEDTDAYGVMYNANYLRAYDRALHMTYCCGGAGEVCNVDPVADTLEGAILRGKLGVLDHEGWSVVELTGQRFKSSPPLGGEFVVSGRLAGRSENRRSEVWEMQIRKPRADADGAGEDGDEGRGVVYNTATVTIARPDLSPSCVPKPPPLEEASAASSFTTESTFTPFRDEFDAHLPTHMPLRNVLNLFERARTSSIGDLRRMQVEDDLIWVVTRVDRCALVNLGRNTIGDDDEDDNDDDYDLDIVECHPGRDVVVRTNFVPKRRGMIVECRHTLLVPQLNQSGADASDGSASTSTKGRRIAQAVVTIMALNGTTRRPTTDLPAWLLEKMNGT